VNAPLHAPSCALAQAEKSRNLQLIPWLRTAGEPTLSRILEILADIGITPETRNLSCADICKEDPAAFDRVIWVTKGCIQIEALGGEHTASMGDRVFIPVGISCTIRADEEVCILVIK